MCFDCLKKENERTKFGELRANANWGGGEGETKKKRLRCGRRHEIVVKHALTTRQRTVVDVMHFGRQLLLDVRLEPTQNERAQHAVQTRHNVVVRRVVVARAAAFRR
jgi:hypothetical protein